MNSKEMEQAATLLDELQQKENNGRGITHIRTIITFLRRGDFDLAVNTYQIEGDKTRAYPTLVKALRDIFGCRMHLNKMCVNELCKETGK